MGAISKSKIYRFEPHSTPPQNWRAGGGGGQSLAAQTEAIDVLCVIISSQVGPALPTLEYSMLHWYKRDIQMT